VATAAAASVGSSEEDLSTSNPLARQEMTARKVVRNQVCVIINVQNKTIGFYHSVPSSSRPTTNFGLIVNVFCLNNDPILFKLV